MSYDRQQMKVELERDEGLRLDPYRCTAGKLTIGIGRNLDDVGIRPEETAKLGLTKKDCIAIGLTKAQAYDLLDYDIDQVEKDLDAKLPWWRGLSPVRQRVMVNMTFNMGINGLLGFRNTLRFIQIGRYDAAAVGMSKSAWHRQVGRRAIRLEAMMRTG